MEVAKLIVVVNYFSQFIHALRGLFPADISGWKRALSPAAFTGAGELDCMLWMET